MELLKSYKIDDILNKKIGIEISVADFLSMYIAKMVCIPSEFEHYAQELFPYFNDINLFTESVSVEEMEDIIDELDIPHEKWL